MKSWAKVRGAYVLSRRNIARIIAAIAAAIFAFHTSAAALSPAEEALSRRAFSALDSVRHIEDSMPSGVRLVAVSDRVFDELAEMFFTFRHLLPCASATARTRKGVQPAPRRCDRSGIPGWTQKDAAAMLGITTRQLRAYRDRPPDPYWPGWTDPVKLKTWLNARDGGARMAAAIKRHLPLREGGVTERGMVGSRVPPRRV